MMTLGQIAFEAYNENRGGLTHDGRKTPPWEKLTDGVREGWEAAALAASRAAQNFGRQSNAEKVLEFMLACEQEVSETIKLPSKKSMTLAMGLIDEEITEVVTAYNNENLVELADGVADLLYVVYGLAHRAGLPIDELFAEVHRSNMTKVMDDGTVEKDAGGKVLKPVSWSPPDIVAVLEGRSR